MKFLVYLKSEEDHASDLCTVLGILGKKKLFKNFPSLNFGWSQLHFWGMWCQKKG